MGEKNGSRLISDMLQNLYGYRHYAHRKCPTSFDYRFYFEHFSDIFFLGTNCTSLTAPLNGMVLNGIAAVFEDWANYSCDPGWEFPGGILFIETQCNASGLWSVDKPTCQSEFIDHNFL